MRPDCHLSDVTVTCVISSYNHPVSQHQPVWVNIKTLTPVSSFSLSLSLAMQTVVAPGPQIIVGGWWCSKYMISLDNSLLHD